MFRGGDKQGSARDRGRGRSPLHRLPTLVVSRTTPTFNPHDIKRRSRLKLGGAVP